MINNSHDSAESEQATIPGSVLVAGCGFIVTGAGWALFGFLEGEMTASSTSTVFILLALLHVVAGALVLARHKTAVVVGIAVAGIGLGIAVADAQWVLVFTNCVILTLLILARRHVAGNLNQKLRARAE